MSYQLQYKREQKYLKRLVKIVHTSVTQSSMRTEIYKMVTKVQIGDLSVGIITSLSSQHSSSKSGEF